MQSGCQGLSSEEAARRAEKGLSNHPPKKKGDGALAILSRHLLTLFNLLNVLLALCLAMVGGYRNMLFVGVVVSNVVIGLVQELRAKRMHDRLELLARGKICVLRDSLETLLDPQAQVQGDVVRLRRGHQVPADAKVLDGECMVNEALLTGESEPVEKAAGATLLSGSYLTQGFVTAELTAVGESSYAGSLQASARKLKRAASELMGDMQGLIRIVSVAIVPLGTLLFCKQYFLLHLSLEDAVTGSVAAMIGMIPEGLVLLTSVALAVGVVRLGRRGVLVNELFGIESLARTDIVCLDKTGTITRGDMAVSRVESLGDLEFGDVEARMSALTKAFEEEKSPTQDALRARFGAYPEAETATAAIPFSSDRKWLAARFDAFGTLIMGAPERLLEGAALSRAQALASQGMRVLALVQTVTELCGEALPDGLCPLALVVISDQVRPEAQETFGYFTRQGVELKVLSGDSAMTVRRVAAEAGMPGAECAIDMSEHHTPVDYDQLCRQYTIFGRVSPEDKQELVKALRRAGHCVAMIGDGVNDIPALKAADCSIAMAGGSDAACRVAQMTLLNQDFSIMPQIVLEGRRVINNITRASALFLVKNIFSFLLAAFLLALPFVYPFAPIQLTLVSALTIGVPSFFLALQPSKEKVTGSFYQSVFSRALPGGVTVALTSLTLMLLREKLSLNHDQVSTICTVLAGFSGLCVLADACRPFTVSRGTLLALMAGGMTLAMLVFPKVFYLTPLPAQGWAALAALAISTVPVLLGLQKLTNALSARWTQRHSREEKKQTALRAGKQSV